MGEDLFKIGEQPVCHQICVLLGSTILPAIADDRAVYLLQAVS